MIPPTVGRVVIFKESRDAVAQAAIVTLVHDNELVNLCAFSLIGDTYGLTSIRLVQPGTEPPKERCYCEWMPYQVGQAQKAEELQRKLDNADAPEETTG